jgi:hypothetical protein
MVADTDVFRSYPYPIMEKLDMWQKGMFGVFMVLLMTGSSLVLKGVYALVNGSKKVGWDTSSSTRRD